MDPGNKPAFYHNLGYLFRYVFTFAWIRYFRSEKHDKNGSYDNIICIIYGKYNTTAYMYNLWYCSLPLHIMYR